MNWISRSSLVNPLKPFWGWLVTISFLLSLAPAHSELIPTNQVRAAIFNGKGVCEGCAESIGHVLEEMGCRVSYWHQGELTVAAFKGIDLYVQPGGSDRLADTLEVLDGEQIKNLREFVQHGGRYLGICAGAYLAGQKVDQQRTAMFGLLPINIRSESQTAGPRLKSVIWQNQKKYLLYFQDGPYFDLAPLTGAQIFGRYEKSGHVAAFIAASGAGKVGLIGPHLEADKDWFKEDHLPLPPLHFRKLGKEFITALMKH